MRIVTLIENTSERTDLTAEHGLSLYIETRDKRILFDAGASGAFADNARKLGIDLGAVDFAVLSHGHYDHGGGLERFLEINPSAPVYMNRRAFGAHYNGREEYIGLDQRLAENSRVVLTDDRFRITAGMTLYSCNDRSRSSPMDTFGLSVRENGVPRPDDFLHEHYLLIEENGKRICISGCSHKGILNIAGWFRPNVLVGGFHFMKIAPEAPYLIRAAEALLAYPATYYTGHCTGLAQYDAMKRIMGARLQRMTTGAEILI